MISLWALTACVEIIEFNTNSEDKAVIIEGEFTDVSALEYFAEFGEYRFFEVKLKWASEVKNVRDEPITGAEIELAADGTEFWDYTEVEPGVYQLLHPDLKAEPGVQYQLTVNLPTGGTIVSNLEQLPDESKEGEISLKEKSEAQYVSDSGEEVIRVVDGVEVSIEIPGSSLDHNAYYRWDFQTTWVLSGSFVRGTDVGRCWVTEQYFFDEYKLMKAKDFALSKPLFFLTVDETNPKVEHGFAVRVRQLSLTSENYSFWLDLQKQGEQADLFAPPPFNLSTNLSATTDDLDVYGYFGVSNERNYIWYFDIKQYSNPPVFIDPCFPIVPAPDFPPHCANCLNYDGLRHNDQITNIQPRWWSP